MNSKEYKCNICNKLYASYKSLWDHNKKFHKNVVNNENKNVTIETNNVTMETKNVTIETKNVVKIKKNPLECEYCKKIFANRHSKSEHKRKSCKSKPINNNISIKNNPTDALLDKLNILEKKNIELEKSLNELKELFINNKKK